MKILEEYKKCINKIDDYLEYIYRSDTPEEIRNRILHYLSELEDALNNKNK